MNINEAREAWMTRNHPRLDNWESEADALREAFAAGWNAARPTICGTGQGATHNTDGRRGQMKVTIWGHTGDGQSIALVYDEEAIGALVADLERFDLLRRS